MFCRHLYCNSFINISMTMALGASLACGTAADNNSQESTATSVATSPTTSPDINPSTATTTTSTGSSGNSSLGLGSNAAPFTSIDHLPPTAGTVAVNFGLKVTAAQGIPLASVSTDEFGNSYSHFVGKNNIATFFPTTTGSFAGCETLNYARGVFGFLGDADRMMCVLGKSVGDKLSDTNFKIYSVTMPNGLIAKLRVRKIADSSGKIKAVEAMMCKGSGVSLKQNQYVSWDFSGEDIAIHVRGIDAPENPDVSEVSYDAKISAKGVTAEGQIQGEKNIELSYQNIFKSGGNNHVSSSSTQSPIALTINHASCERLSLTADCDPSRSQRILSHMAIIDNNLPGKQSPNFMGIGAGAALLSVGGSTGLQQWNDSGLTDNTAQSTAGNEVRQIKDKLKELSKDSVRVEFTDDQTWDCSGDATALEPLSTAMKDCATLSIDQNQHLDCAQANLSQAVQSL